MKLSADQFFDPVYLYVYRSTVYTGEVNTVCIYTLYRGVCRINPSQDDGVVSKGYVDTLHFSVLVSNLHERSFFVNYTRSRSRKSSSESIAGCAITCEASVLFVSPLVVSSLPHSLVPIPVTAWTARAPTHSPLTALTSPTLQTSRSTRKSSHLCSVW